MIQSSGEAQFVNDIPPMPKEVFGAFVLSTIHSGKVDQIKADDVLVSKTKSLVKTPNFRHYKISNMEFCCLITCVLIANDHSRTVNSN